MLWKDSLRIFLGSRGRKEEAGQSFSIRYGIGQPEYRMKLARRMSALHTSVFTELKAEKERLEQEEQMTVLDFSLGSPDIPPAQSVIDTLCEQAAVPANYRYAVSPLPELVKAIQDWYQEHYEVCLKPSEICLLQGSQEALVNLPLLFCNPHDGYLIPDPYYPAYLDAPRMAEADVLFLPLKEENDYLIDFDAISEEERKKARMMLVNYPNNPTGAVAPDWFIEKLIRFAKEKITKLAAHDEPFNFTMLTADTHFKDGYLCKNCPDDFDEQYENVIRCSDKRIAEFVEWIQQQDFYDDTVIMISGDHLSMDSLINQSVGIDFPRRTYFTVINGAPYTLDRTRDYCTLDIFPTTLEAMGFTIQGHKLGLGTSLYADVPTLCEEFGFDDLNTQIAYRSKRFEDEILKNDGYTPEEEDDGFLPFFFNRDDSSSSSSHQTPRLPVFEEE